MPALNFDELQLLVDALQPFAEFTKQLSARDASISEILPIYYVIKNMANSDEDEDQNIVTKIQNVCAQKLIGRMEKMVDDK